MKRAALIIILAPLLVLSILLVWAAGTESGLQWLAARATAMAPGEIHYAQITGRLIGPLSLDDFSYQIDGTRVQAQRIELDWQPTELLLSVVHVSQFRISDLTIDLPEAAPPAEAPEAPLHLPDIQLPLRFKLENIAVDQISITRLGDTLLALDSVTLAARADEKDLEITSLSVQAPDYQARVAGEIRPQGQYKHDLHLEWQVTLPEYPAFSGTGRLEGDLRQTRFIQTVDGPLSASLDIGISDMIGQLRWAGDIEVKEFDTQAIRQDWPAVTGSLKVRGQGDLAALSADGSYNSIAPMIGANQGDFRLDWHPERGLTIAGLEMRIAATGSRLNLVGQWLPGEDFGRAGAVLSWQNIQWPLAGAAMVNSQAGKLQVDGTLQGYSVMAEAEVSGPNIPDSTLNLRGDGTLESLTLGQISIATLDGTVEGAGEVRWSPELAWRATLRGSMLDPGQMLAQWPGRLGFQLASSGKLKDSGLESELLLEDLSGTLRGYPFKASSALDIKGQVIDIRHFALRSGQSQVMVQGRYGDDMDLRYQVNAIDLSHLYPEASGALKADGTVRGTPEAPEISLNAAGEKLRFQEYGIDTLQTRLHADLLRWQSIQGDIKAEGIVAAGARIEKAHIKASGSDASHQASMFLDAYDTSLTLEATGGMNQRVWEGRVSRADISNRQFGDWALKEAIALSAGAESLSIPDACWVSGEATACVDVVRENQKLNGTWNVIALPLAYLSSFLPNDIALSGLADLTGKARFDEHGSLRAETLLQLPAGVVSYPLLEGEYDTWEYQNGQLSAQIDEKGLRAKLRMTLNKDEYLNADADLPGFNPMAFDAKTQKILASARIHLRDLGLIEALVPEAQDIEGRIDVEVKADGTLAQPHFSGQAALINGSLRIPRLGLTITRIGINAETEQFDTLHFRLSARSGDGTLRAEGKTQLSARQGWPTEIAIKGENVEVSRIPEARVEVSPDLAIRIVHREMHVRGDIHIPQARLQPKDTTSAVRVSDDVVIVGAPEPAPEKWLIHTQIRVILGDRIHFFGYGFEGRIGGNLVLTDKPSELTLATGELTVPEGRYRAYGQRLEIEHGRILYAGGPVSNPGLDIQAIRRVGDVVAGIKILGTLRAPRLELFSIPAMGQTDALAYLVLGRPLEQTTSGEDGALMAQAALALSLKGGDFLARSLGERFGLDEMRIETSDTGEQASLVIGRYLSPKLYVSYGVGLIEAVNTINIRYQIAKNWHLKAESGTYQQADLLYTIER